MELEKYKIEKIGKRGEISIWIVNGKLIRDSLDIEFTNFGQHFRFDFIPLNEFWLDVEAEPNERKYFIDHLLSEWKAMKDGLIYEDALTMASKVEFVERQKDELSKNILDSRGRIMLQTIHKESLGITNDGIAVWRVDGKKIRSNFDIDFTEGGHDLVYDFVPEKEIWLDDDLLTEELSYVLLHELHERKLMSSGLAYNDAHGGMGEIEGASQIEWRARRDKELLDGFLSDLGWQTKKQLL